MTATAFPQLQSPNAQPAQSGPRRIYKFRLLHGKHVGPHPDQIQQGTPRERCIDYLYSAGEMVYDTIDLSGYNGRAVDAIKFERMVEDERRDDPYIWHRDRETLEQFTERMKGLCGQDTMPQPDQVQSPPTTIVQESIPPIPPENPNKVGLSDELNSMTLIQLQKYADEEEIGLKGAKDRGQIIQAILRAKAAQAK